MPALYLTYQHLSQVAEGLPRPDSADRRAVQGAAPSLEVERVQRQPWAPESWLWELLCLQDWGWEQGTAWLPPQSLLVALPEQAPRPPWQQCLRRRGAALQPR